MSFKHTKSDTKSKARHTYQSSAVFQRETGGQVIAEVVAVFHCIGVRPAKKDNFQAVADLWGRK